MVLLIASETALVLFPLQDCQLLLHDFWQYFPIIQVQCKRNSSHILLSNINWKYRKLIEKMKFIGK